MSKKLVERLSGALADRTSRRGFLVRSAVVGSALAVAPRDFVLRPLTAYQAICGCGNLDCDCGAACCNGWTQFCCSINGGYNLCPAGTFLGGWWKADGSTYCAGPRYYMDCNAYCSCNTVVYESFCDTACDGLSCECAGGSCDNMHIGCAQFRYGQCHQEVAVSGRILCRVVSCTPPWELDTTCTTVTLVDDGTAEQNAPCLQNPLVPPAPRSEYPSIVAVPTGRGYWLARANGDVYSFGDAAYHGSVNQLDPTVRPGGANAVALPAPVVSMAASPTGGGYWLATANGEVYSFGDASYYGSMAQLNPALQPGGANSANPGETVVAMAVFPVPPFAPTTTSTAPPTTTSTTEVPVPPATGYWLATANGDVYSFGDAAYHGSAP